MERMARKPRHAKVDPNLGGVRPKMGESLSEALVTLLTVVLFGLGWAHVEIGRVEAGGAGARRYAAPSTVEAAPLPAPAPSAPSWTREIPR
jgi:hypothetical protein